MSLKTIDPSSGKLIKEYKEMSDIDVDKIITEVGSCYQQWRHFCFKDRSALMFKAADQLEQRKAELASLMAREMGKPISGGIGEIEKCAWVCRYYAEHAEIFLSDESIASDANRSKVVYRPMGTVLAVMPWNFPFWQVFRFAAPALMAGNTGVLKHASNVCGSALAIENIFKEAGFPENSFRSLLIGSKKVARVIENPLIKAVTLTGSTPAGKAVASKAGEMLKKTVLELGGSDPYIVLADAAIDSSVEACVTSRMVNSGQSCIAAKRFIVEASVVDEFKDKFVESMKLKVYGDPNDESTEFGPMARVDLRDELHNQVLKSIERGATLLLGGKIPPGEGCFYPATVLCDVKPGMPAYDEELFGPVAAIISADDEEDAIRIANDTKFGLGAAIFTKDDSHGELLAADKIEAGACFVNTFVKSDPRLPFGGIGESGYGRELSHHGIKEFVNIKTVYIA